MTLKLSPLDGGPLLRSCGICGAPLQHQGQMKCSKCAHIIAEKVTEEFAENIAHELTEAIMKTDNDALIDTVVKGNKILEENTKKETLCTEKPLLK